MPANNLLFERLALLTEFAQRATLGRTAIMKLLFFLQESKGLPLGYQFSLYSYGPFDSDVLSDITTAVRLNVLKSNVVYYTSGTGYEYTPGSDASSVRELARSFLSTHKDDIDWALSNFGSRTAGELELLSTTLFVAKFHNPKDVSSLMDQVQLIKPHFSRDQIETAFHNLVLLEVLRPSPVLEKV